MNSRLFGKGELLEQLTEREAEVAMMAARGMSNKEIADCLIIGLGTVKHHIHSALGKLGLKSRHQIRHILVNNGVELNASSHRIV